MDERNQNEKLIYKLIEKRKQEIDAFQKLLDAMTNKHPDQREKNSHFGKKKN